MLRYQFYADSENDTAGATITYTDADAWVADHRLAYQWEEMPKLQAIVKLRSLTLFVPLSEELDDWLDSAELEYSHNDRFAAGFVRS